MFWTTIAIACLSAPVPALPKAEADLRGSWVIVSGEADGKLWTKEKRAELKVVISEEWLEYVNVGKPQLPNLLFALELDRSTDLKGFTLTHNLALKNSAVYGICELDGETLRMCFTDGEGRGDPTRRPTAFGAPAGSHQVLMALKREEAGPDRVLQAMDGFRKALPEPASIGEMNGPGVKDTEGKLYPASHLKGVGVRLAVRTRGEGMDLLTYLKDADPKLRWVAAFALEEVVKAYPGGMSGRDIDELKTEGHRKMVEAFIAGIEKLPK